MKRSSDSLEKNTIDPSILSTNIPKKRRTYDTRNSKKSSLHKPHYHSPQDKKPTPDDTFDLPLNEPTESSNSINSIDRFLQGLFTIDNVSKKEKPIRQNWEITKDLSKTYEALALQEADESKGSVSLKYKESYNQKRDRVKESKAEEKKCTDDLLLKKIESITTGESGSEFDKPSTSRIRNFVTQSYSTDITASEYPKDFCQESPTLKEGERQPRRKIPLKKRSPTENKWLRTKEPIDTSKPLSPWKPESAEKANLGLEGKKSHRSRSKSGKKSRGRSSKSVSIERARRESVDREPVMMVEHTIIKESEKQFFDYGLLEELKRKEHEFIMKIEELSRDKSFWEEIAQKKEHTCQELMQENSVKESALEELRRELIRSEAYRSELHNHIHELRGNLRIFCRIKPYEGQSTILYPEKSHCATISKLKSVEIGIQSK